MLQASERIRNLYYGLNDKQGILFVIANSIHYFIPQVRKKGPQVRKGKAMLQIHLNGLKGNSPRISYRLFDLQGTIMPTAKKAEWLNCDCLYKAGSSGCLGRGAFMRRPE